MPRILVSQLARMGDLTQSLYLLRDLAEGEGCAVSVLIDKRLEGFVRRRAPWLDTVHTLDLEKYLRGFREGVPWTRLWPGLAEELRPVRNAPFERLINLNYGKLAAAVTEAVRGEAPVSGFHAGPEGSPGDPWVEFVSRLIQSDRRWNRFHLVDVFRFHAGRRAPFAGRDAAEPSPLSDRSVVGVQLATRCGKRTWGPESFIELLRGLAREVGCEILLLGERRETALAETVARRVGFGRLRNLAGKTSLEDLVEVLGACDRLVSGDTGTLHLAAYLGVPCLAVFFGPAYVFETGPYGKGHVVFQASLPCAPCREETVCRDERCRALVPPGPVLGVLVGETLDPEPRFEVYAPGFADDWIAYRPLHRRPACREDVIAFLYWGCAGDYLRAPLRRMPSLSTSLRLLVDHYRITRPLLQEVDASLDTAVPESLPRRDRERLRAILRKGFTELKRICHEPIREQPCRLATATA